MSASRRPIARFGREFVQQIADRAHHLDVRFLAVAADAIGLADAALGGDDDERAGVVVDVKPVAHVVAGAVDRKRLALEAVDDDERDQLFGEMVGAVIVRAVGHHDGKP